MASRGEVNPLDYTPTLVDWAERFSDLPGFVYLDSGTGGHGGLPQCEPGPSARRSSAAHRFASSTTLEARLLAVCAAASAAFALQIWKRRSRASRCSDVRSMVLLMLLAQVLGRCPHAATGAGAVPPTGTKRKPSSW